MSAAAPHLVYPPPDVEPGDDGGDEAQLVVMTSIIDEPTGTTWTNRVAIDHHAGHGELVNALLATARGATASFSTNAHAVLIDALTEAPGQPDALTVRWLDHAAAHHPSGGAGCFLELPGDPPVQVPFVVARAVLVAAGAW